MPSIHKLRNLKTGVIVRCENTPGGTGPDYAVIELRNGKVIELSDDGLNVYPDTQAFQNGKLAPQGLVFQSTTWQQDAATVLNALARQESKQPAQALPPNN